MRHYLRYADVPFSHLHGPGPGSSRTAGGDRRYQCEESVMKNVWAGSDLKGRSTEIFYQDFQKFELNKANFGVGTDQLHEPGGAQRDEKAPASLYGKGSGSTRRDHMIFFHADGYHPSVHRASATEARMCASCGRGLSSDTGEHSITLPGVVSRKKQLIPAFMNAPAAVRCEIRSRKGERKNGKRFDGKTRFP